MARYVDIENDVLLEAIGREAFKSRDDIRELLDKIPTADVVEVVRCKDCLHYKAYSDPLKGFYGECLIRGCDIGETEFCSYGMRKEGANSDL